MPNVEIWQNYNTVPISGQHSGRTVWTLWQPCSPTLGNWRWDNFQIMVCELPNNRDQHLDNIQAMLYLAVSWTKWQLHKDLNWICYLGTFATSKSMSTVSHSHLHKFLSDIIYHGSWGGGYMMNFQEISMVNPHSVASIWPLYLRNT